MFEMGEVQRLRMVLTILVFGLGVAVAGAAPEDSLDEFLAREMPASGVPGLSYAVVAANGTTSTGARGVAMLGSDRKVTPDTPFVTGSISKSFTALAVMQLVEAGAVDLDAPLERYLTGFAGRPAGSVTIRQLLSHTSGFSTLQGNAARPDPAGGTGQLARRVEALAESAPAHSPGTRWEYSNTNYQILGRVIEVVSGESFQAYVTRHILEPIGMAHSFVADGRVHDGVATGHRSWFVSKRPMPNTVTPRASAPQGGIIASAADLARYLRVMMNGEDDVLSAGGKELMMRPASAASPFYGLGWFVDSARGTVWHSGSSPGFETLATMMPAAHRAAVVLVNGGSGLGFGETTQLRNGITTRALGLAYAGEGSRWSQKALFLGLVLLPLVYLLSMGWAWWRRDRLRAKSGAFGRFSLWFPLVTTLVGAWVILGLMPALFGVPLGTLARFQPDLGVVLVASAVTGVTWAVFRLAVAYSGRPRGA